MIETGNWGRYKKILVCGSRKVDTTDTAIIKAVARFIDGLPPGTEIRTGGAVGIDQLAEKLARGRPDLILVPATVPDYKQYGRAAPLVRDKALVEWADAVAAFWDGESRGTAYTIACARAQGKFYGVQRID